jgi:hypothetical protein
MRQTVIVNQLIIPLHSVVDVITNSSTVIYTGTQESAKSAMRSIINHILKQAGSDQEALDLYNIEVVGYNDIEKTLEERGITYKDNPDQYWAEYERLEEEPSGVFEQVRTVFSDNSTYPKTSIVVTPKTDAEDDYVTKMLGKLFYVEEDYA